VGRLNDRLGEIGTAGSRNGTIERRERGRGRERDRKRERT
jgi:hypothetical protein